MYPQRPYFCVYPVSTLFHLAGDGEDAPRQRGGVDGSKGSRDGANVPHARGGVERGQPAGRPSEKDRQPAEIRDRLLVGFEPFVRAVDQIPSQSDAPANRRGHQRHEERRRQDRPIRSSKIDQCNLMGTQAVRSRRAVSLPSQRKRSYFVVRKTG